MSFSKLADSKKKIVIAIDGFSSCGKSTLAKSLAQKLSYIHIDSGAMYRAVTWYFIKHSINIESNSELLNSLSNMNIEFTYSDKGESIIWLNGIDISKEIRAKEVSDYVSIIAKISAVRKYLVSLQREYGVQKGIVMDGRDIGTVVFPKAELKLFLTASEEIRANRRYKELIEMGIPLTKDEVIHNIHSRDFIDSTREDSPLKQADDAIVIDNSFLTRDEQLSYSLELVQKITE